MRFLVALTACVLVVTSCSTDTGDEPASSPTTSRSQSPQDAGTPSATASPSPAPRATESTAPSRPAAPAGSAWSVVGVARGDRLNVRRGPDASTGVVARLAPLATGVQVTERSAGAWRQVTVGGRDGWAHGRYLARLGRSVDITVEAREVGIAPTRTALARKVAGRQAEAGEGPLTGPVLVARKGRTVTADVLGYADDSVLGERFRVVAVPGEAGFEVLRATATPICARGVEESGLCL